MRLFELEVVTSKPCNVAVKVDGTKLYLNNGYKINPNHLYTFWNIHAEKTCSVIPRKNFLFCKLREVDIGKLYVEGTLSTEDERYNEELY